MRRVLCIVLALGLLLTVVSACADSTPAPEAPAPEAPAPEAPAPEAPAETPSGGDSGFEVALSLKTITNDAFQLQMSNAVEAACEAKGLTFTLVTAGDDVATQVTQLEDLVTRGVDALIVNPMDANAVIPALQRAKEAGIPVVLIDSTIADGNDDLFISYIGTDNFAAAKIGAEALSEAMGGTGEAILVRGASGNSVGNARADGFKAGLASGIELVGEQPGDWRDDVAKQVTENMLQGNPGVTGIMSASDVMVNGIIQAIEDSGLSIDNIYIMSFDGDSIELIKEGLVFGTMAQFPDEMGRIAVDVLYQVVTGAASADSFDKFIDSGTALFNATNLP